MDEKKIPHLCGGIFFALILQARKTRWKVRNRQKGGTDSLSATDVFTGLAKAMTGEDIGLAGKTLSKCASLYKTCVESRGVYVPFTDSAAIRAFDSLVRSGSPVARERMVEFIDTYLSREKCEWLAGALVDTICRDAMIPADVAFDIGGRAVPKAKLAGVKTVVFPDFLLSVFHYVLTHDPSAESGRPTFEAWFTQRSPSNPWIYNGNAGAGIEPIHLAFEVEEAGEDEEAEDLEDEEILRGVPLVVQGARAGGGVAPDLSEILDAEIYKVDGDLFADDEDLDFLNIEHPTFARYIEGATEARGKRKTLINPEEGRPFYDIYVCNDLEQSGFRKMLPDAQRKRITISNGTVGRLEEAANTEYIIIQGTGGIGKSMYMTHLFLSCASEYVKTGVVPVLVMLKDYKEDTPDVLGFIISEVRSYDGEISRDDILGVLRDGKAVLLLDGLDEIMSSVQDAFFKSLELLIRRYPGNTVVITSRPIQSFISFSRFFKFDIRPLTKEQAVTLIRKTEFWDEESKASFLEALERSLYVSHREFASNPLLLTIMLMTYSMFGEIPARMHVFYAKAYETMARLHDSTKGSFKRPLHTGLTPEKFKDYFAEFCARTYISETLEFSESDFSDYMEKVLKKTPPEEQDARPEAFRKDLTDNLCIMYEEGGVLCFIHRSFQEYFTAFYFAHGLERNLADLGRILDGKREGKESDKVFDMLYDMIPRKVEERMLHPLLEKRFEKWRKSGDSYWGFLEDQYPLIEGANDSTGRYNGAIENKPSSYVYKKAILLYGLEKYPDLEILEWPGQALDMDTTPLYEVYGEFLHTDAYDRYPNADDIPEEMLEDTMTLPEDYIPYRYYNYFGRPEQVGDIIHIDVGEIRADPASFDELVEFMERDEFPLKQEFRAVERYFTELDNRIRRERESESLFDD